MMAEENVIGRIKVVRTPDGTAPSWVREAWKGLILTCFPQVVCFSDDPFNSSGKNVGFVVAQHQAIRELVQHNQPAADWWQENWYGGDGGFFFFSIDDVEVVSGIPMLGTCLEKNEVCIDVT
jgi:hypothetical protein